MRVTQQQLFTNFINNMNRSLTDLMESNMQASSQKRINRPSDDPVGTARVLDLRSSLQGIKNFQKNIDTAKGWLGLADETLIQTSTIITRAKELAEQASTGTLTKENREEISYEVRQIFEQVVGLANTSYDDRSIFAGHKVDQPAYRERLWLMANDFTLDNTAFKVTGQADRTMLVQFTDTANPGGGTNLQLDDPNLEVRYSTDGGDTFKTASVSSSGGQATLDLGTAQVTLDQTTEVTTTDQANTNDTDGTWFYVRPTAEYMGDDGDGVDINAFGPDGNAQASAAGVFSSSVAVRIDSATTLSNVSYSYSVDGGSSWKSGNTFNGTAASNATLDIPGGVLHLGSNGGIPSAGAQFVINPRTADIDLQIFQNQKVTINNVGTDIFGGVYADPSTISNANPNGSPAVAFADDVGRNLFEAMGKLVAYTETNNQDGIQQVLEDLKKAHNQVMNQTASVAGRENRLSISESILDGLKVDEEERISEVEDADVGELMTRLAQQQIAYESVLKSSSMIMKMTLVNFV
nr:flagellar hook-associated protein FlgL [Desulfohalovibrio reitneri]